MCVWCGVCARPPVDGERFRYQSQNLRCFQSGTAQAFVCLSSVESHARVTIHLYLHLGVLAFALVKDGGKRKLLGEMTLTDYNPYIYT